VIWIFIISIVFFFSIGIAYYYDYKNDRKGFKKSLYGVFTMILIFIAIEIATKLLEKSWKYIFN